jgi:hypothetical protein
MSTYSNNEIVVASGTRGSIYDPALHNKGHNEKYRLISRCKVVNPNLRSIPSMHVKRKRNKTKTKRFHETNLTQVQVSAVSFPMSERFVCLCNFRPSDQCSNCEHWSN